MQIQHVSCSERGSFMQLIVLHEVLGHHDSSLLNQVVPDPSEKMKGFQYIMEKIICDT